MPPASKIIITGSLGQLGSDLLQFLSLEYDVVGLDLPEFDITDPIMVDNLIARIKPTVVIHAAAFTDVDRCESNSSEAMAVNEGGTRNIARASAENKARLIYYSTDYVFDGLKSSPYLETDSPNPATIYGQSKLAGEKVIEELCDNYAILRLAWVYGATGKNFVKTISKLGRDQVKAKTDGAQYQPLKVVDDQFGSPSWTVDIVEQTRALLESSHNGIFHATAEGETTWNRLARDIFKQRGLEVELIGCTTAEFPRPAPRPPRSTLENARLKRLDLNRMRHYREALKEFLDKHEDI